MSLQASKAPTMSCTGCKNAQNLAEMTKHFVLRDCSAKYVMTAVSNLRSGKQYNHQHAYIRECQYAQPASTFFKSVFTQVGQQPEQHLTCLLAWPDISARYFAQYFEPEQ